MSHGLLALTPREVRATVGDDWPLAFTLWDDGVVKDVHLASAITAAIQDLSGNTSIETTACTSGASGANWTAGIVVTPFTAAQTAYLRATEYFIQLTVTLAGVRTTWPLVPVMVQNAIL